jgi:hypothetical protein
MPDASHLHQLIYMRIVRLAITRNDDDTKTQQNAMTSTYLWVLALLSVIPAVLFWRYHMVLKGFAALFAISYVWFYWSIVRFKVPAWMSIKR